VANIKNRYLLKLSGELLKGDRGSGLCLQTADRIVKRIVPLIKSGVELGIVIGGGNIFRGASAGIDGYDRRIGDQIGMMATVINALSLVERFRANGVNALPVSAIEIAGVASLFNIDLVESSFKNAGVVVFCGGIGNPYLSTDTTAAIRALQINAQAVFKATKVDGIYDKDPVKYCDAKLYSTITFDEIIKNKLKVMDLSAMILMRDNNMKLMVFSMNDEGMLEKACRGETAGTIVKE